MKKVAFILLAILMLSISSMANAENWDEFYVVRQEEESGVTILLDRVTGIQYIKTDSGICPRLFTDGTPYSEECE